MPLRRLSENDLCRRKKPTRISATYRSGSLDSKIHSPFCLWRRKASNINTLDFSGKNGSSGWISLWKSVIIFLLSTKITNLSGRFYLKSIKKHIFAQLWQSPYGWIFLISTKYSRTRLRRLPWYLAYVKLLKNQGESYVSSTQIAKKSMYLPLK